MVIQIIDTESIRRPLVSKDVRKLVGFPSSISKLYADILIADSFLGSCRLVMPSKKPVVRQSAHTML